MRTITGTIFTGKSDAAELQKKILKMTSWSFRNNSRVQMNREETVDNIASGTFCRLLEYWRNEGTEAQLNLKAIRFHVMREATSLRLIPKNYGKRLCVGTTECLQCGEEFDWSMAKLEIVEWRTVAGELRNETRAFCPDCGERLITSRLSILPKLEEMEVTNADGEVIRDNAPATPSCEQQTANRYLVMKLLKVASPAIRALLAGHLEGRPAVQIAEELKMTEARLSELWCNFRVQASKLTGIKLQKSEVMNERAEKKLAGGLFVAPTIDPTPAAPAAQEEAAAAEEPKKAPKAKKLKTTKLPKSELEHLRARAAEYAGGMFSLDELFTDAGLAVLQNAPRTAPQVSA
jgi:DNA-directed RNA polymerase subunit RPC12/RpoP